MRQKVGDERVRSFTIEYGDDVLIKLGLSPEQFCEEARMIIAVKLYEMGRLSAGSAAAFAVETRRAVLDEAGERA